MSVNDRQVGGDHYKKASNIEEHWDRVARLGLSYFQAQVTKYVERCRLKNGLQDLEKAQHFLEKMIELTEERKNNILKLGNPHTTRAVALGLDYAQGQITALVESGTEEDIRKAHEQLIHYINITKFGLLLKRAEDDGVVYSDDEEVQEPEVKPNGYIGYTYEGGTRDWDLFRCCKCREEVRMPRGAAPKHTCI